MTVLDPRLAKRVKVSDGGLITRMLDIANGLDDVIKLDLFTIRWEAQISGLSFRASPVGHFFPAGDGRFDDDRNGPTDEKC